MNPSLSDIIDNWLKDNPQLAHFRIVRLTWRWIACECIDHAWADNPAFRLTQWGVSVHSGPYITTQLPASDPIFFDKLRQELIKVCKEAKKNSI